MSTHRVIQALTAKLFVPEERRLSSLLVTLNNRNKQLTETTWDGFIHGGVYHLPTSVSTTSLSRLQPKTPLHALLHEDMQYYLKDREAVLAERRLISQALFLLLDPCKSGQDMRDALPECLVACLDFGNLQRTREMAWTIQNNPRALRQFEKILPVMEVYSTSGLLY